MVCKLNLESLWVPSTGSAFSQGDNMSHKPVQWLTVMLLVIITVSVHSERNKGRRAVAEHQLMHDRGQNIQSLKRLIWLTSAIDSLHTAETRSAPLYPHLIPAVGITQPDQVQSLLRNFFKTPLTQLPNQEY